MRHVLGGVLVSVLLASCAHAPASPGPSDARVYVAMLDILERCVRTYVDASCELRHVTSSEATVQLAMIGGDFVTFDVLWLKGDPGLAAAVHRAMLLECRVPEVMRAEARQIIVERTRTLDVGCVPTLVASSEVCSAPAPW